MKTLLCDMFTMSLDQPFPDKNAERVCIQKFKFTIGRTIRSSHLGASPTRRPIFGGTVFEIKDDLFKATVPCFVRSMIEFKQPTQ
jgi:hypothetical protein